MSTIHPVNLLQWIDANRAAMKPPVSNKTVWANQDFIVFVGNGPNTRNDYHVNPTEEFFYQLKGDIYVKIREHGKSRDVVIREGEIYLIPAWVPHSPQRPPNTLGLVVEYKRPTGQRDALQWYCPACDALVFEEHFTLTDIDQNLRQIMERFWGDDPTIRTCRQCKTVIQRATEARLPA